MSTAKATDGAVAYQAYRRSTRGKTYDGREMPPWNQLGSDIQRAWEASASAVLALHRAEVDCNG